MDVFINSLKGTKSAWKGFSSQTLYIANRLLLQDNLFDFYPENVEDLLIKDKSLIIESVQIKNYSSELTLSDLKPQQPDCFFRRSLSLRKNNPNLKITLISFGPLGSEFIGVQNNKLRTIELLQKRLIENYKYAFEDAKWIFDHLTINLVNEEVLKNQIFSILSTTIETSPAPEIAFEVLTNYISRLSEKTGKTSIIEWNKKTHNIAIDFASLHGFNHEYGISIIPLFEYRTNLSVDVLSQQYHMGINAHPDHIRNNLDFVRDSKISQIEEAFLSNQTVIIRSASGEGKSSLAFRYLIDHYPEANIFILNDIETSIQAENIIAALNGLSSSRESELIVYMDIKPYQKRWANIIEQLQHRGKRIKILVTIREEDYHRSNFEQNGLLQSPAEIELSFTEDEARWIFEKFNSRQYMNFKEAWDKFGGKGPLMEFMYLLNQTESLRSKLEYQVNIIKIGESNSDELILVLLICSYVGRFNLSIDVQKIRKKIACKNIEKMIYLFEKEYLLQQNKDKTIIETIHSVRAEILFNLLNDGLLITKEELLLTAIECVNFLPGFLIIDYCYTNDYDIKLIDKIASISYTNWSNLASSTQGILWLEVYDLYKTNEIIIKEGDSLSDNQFSYIMMADITGLFQELNLSDSIDLLQEKNPSKYKLFKATYSKLITKNLNYQYIDHFFSYIVKKLPKSIPCTNYELSDLGTLLYLLSIRNFYIDNIFSENEIQKIFDEFDVFNFLDFLEGLYYQKLIDIYQYYVPLVKIAIAKKKQIVYIEELNEHIKSNYVLNLFSSEDYDDKGEEERSKVSQQTMDIVKILNKLYPGKEQYGAKVIGASFVENIPIFDGEKDVLRKYLPNPNLVQLNKWFHNLIQYTNRPSSWLDFVNKILDIRKNISESAKIILSGIDYFYKKGGNLIKLVNQENIQKFNQLLEMINEPIETPKICNDLYGLNEIDKNLNTKNFFSTNKQYFNKYSLFLSQMNELIATRSRGLDNTHGGSLSVINLIDCVSILKDFQNEFENLFSSFCDHEVITELNVDEQKNLYLLVEIWDYFSKVRTQKIDSVQYFLKKKISTRKEKIFNFFSNTIKSCSMVKSFSNIYARNNETFLYISVDFVNLEKFSHFLYEKFHHEFPDAKPLTIESIYLKDCLQNIIIVPEIGNSVLPIGILYKTKNLIYLQEENFSNYVTPIEDDLYITKMSNSLQLEEEIRSWHLLYSLFYSIILFLQYIYKCNQEIIELEKPELINKEVLSQWHEKTANEFTENFEKIVDQNSKFLYLMQKKDITQEIFKTYKDDFNFLLKNHNDYEQEDRFVDVFNLFKKCFQDLTEIAKIF